MRARSILAFLLVVATSSVARGDDADPDALVVHGIELRRERRDAEALDEFRRAYAVRASPRALAQIALAEQALGRWVEAESDLTNALRAGDDAWIVRNRALLESGLAAIQGHLGWIDVAADVDGAELWIDGARMATLPAPQPIRVPAGSVAIEVRAPGRGTVKRAAIVDAGAHAREAVRLVPLADEPPAPSPPAAPPASEPAARAIKAGRGERTVGFVLIGAGVVATGIGAYFGARTFAKKSERDPHCHGDVCDPTGVALDQDARSFATLATVGIGAGVLLAGGGGWLVWDGRARSAPVAVRVAPLIGMDRAGVTVGGAW